MKEVQLQKNVERSGTSQEAPVLDQAHHTEEG